MRDPQAKILHASLIWPGIGPTIRNGGLVIHAGRVSSVGPIGEIRSRHPDAETIDLSERILLPGFVNAHTHLELSTCRRTGDTCTSSFTDWIASIRAQQRSRGDEPESVVREAARVGIDQSLRFGVTCVGDISQCPQWTRPVIAERGLRAVSFGELLGRGKMAARYDELLPLAMDRRWESDRLRIGLTPHAPYTIDRAGYLRAIDLADLHHLPLATHLAETAGETEFLKVHTGPFRQLWESYGLWETTDEVFPGSPVQYAAELGLLSRPTVLAHVNYVSDTDLDLLAKGNASVVYCPRTHQYFGHPRHRFDQMLARGVNVCLGTDSCASSPNLDILAEVRLVHQNAPQLPPETLLEMITTRPARALGINDIGALLPGHWADCVALDVPDAANPLHAIIENEIHPSAVYVAGERII